jgi:putative tricarboxylic transport membrane protein
MCPLKRDLISGMFWLLIGLGLCIWSSAYSMGTLAQPGAGFLPFGLGLLVMLFSLTLIGSTVKSKAETGETSEPLSMGCWKKVLFTILVLVVAGLFFEKVGYLLTFFFLSLFLMIIAGLRGWKQITLVAFCTALGVYIFFVLLLKQPLPTGFLGV